VVAALYVRGQIEALSALEHGRADTAVRQCAQQVYGARRARCAHSPVRNDTLAVSLFKIANDIRLIPCGPRAGFAELIIPENEPGSSIMPGKVDPTQCEALAMVAAQVIGDDVSSGIGGASGYLEMKRVQTADYFRHDTPITIMTAPCTDLRKFLIEGTMPKLKKIKAEVDSSLMLVTALSLVIGYDKASKIAHYAYDNDQTLKAAALRLGFVDEVEFDRIADPKKMVMPYVAH
jgi:fumarate hydratase class II